MYRTQLWSLATACRLHMLLAVQRACASTTSDTPSGGVVVDRLTRPPKLVRSLRSTSASEADDAKPRSLALVASDFDIGDEETDESSRAPMTSELQELSGRHTRWFKRRKARSDALKEMDEWLPEELGPLQGDYAHVFGEYESERDNDDDGEFIVPADAGDNEAQRLRNVKALQLGTQARAAAPLVEEC